MKLYVLQELKKLFKRGKKASGKQKIEEYRPELLIRLRDSVYRALAPDIIEKGFRLTGIHPFNPSEVLGAAGVTDDLQGRSEEEQEELIGHLRLGSRTYNNFQMLELFRHQREEKEAEEFDRELRKVDREIQREERVQIENEKKAKREAEKRQRAQNAQNKRPKKKKVSQNSSSSSVLPEESNRELILTLSIRNGLPVSSRLS